MTTRFCIRRLSLDETDQDADDQRIGNVSLSSESPVERSYGYEVLSHAPGAIDLSRARPTLPLLMNHNTDAPVGTVSNVRTDGTRLRGDFKFFSTAAGRDAYTMATEGLSGVSVGYQVDSMAATDDPGTFRANRWQLLEVSLAPVAADPTVGIGRSLKLKGSTRMDTSTTTPEPLTRAERLRAAGIVQGETAGREAGMLEERDRVAALSELGRRFNAEAITQRAIRDGQSVEATRLAVLELVENRNRQEPVGAAAGDIGMSREEVRGFSIVRAIRAQLTGNWKDAGMERAACEAAARRIGKESAGIIVPTDVQLAWSQRAPYAVGATATGGAMVATELMAASFIDVLRNSADVMRAGATVLSGLVGNVDIPRQTAQTATYWVGESGAVTEAEATFDKIAMMPKTVGAMSNMSRLTLLQTTPAIEMLVRNDLARVLGIAIDLKALSGDGTGNTPTGIASTSGIGSVVGGVNGASLTLDHLLGLQAQLSIANAPNSARGFLANAKSVSTLLGLKSTTGQYLWTDASATNPGQRSGVPRQFAGDAVFTTNQCRANLTKGTSSGVCSEVFYGDWSELIIGEWGVLEILVNPFDSTGFTSGDVKIRALQTIDIQVRHAASFAIMSDALTAY